MHTLKVGNISYAHFAVDPLLTYTLTGDTHPVRDPSILRQGKTYYLFSTDAGRPHAGSSLPIRCSQDEVSWTACGSVFSEVPPWLRAKVPGIGGLWAPDISYFNGLYHVYYSASTLGSQRSVIGLATNTTLDAGDPAYKWVDRGEVLHSSLGDDFNAIDPNILVDTTGRIWLTYGSYWSGIKQQQISPATGKLIAKSKRYDLATRPAVPNNPIEGASLVHHSGFYYLFVSIDYCCNRDLSTDNYKEAVGRSTSPHGPFLDMQGTPMMNGGGTVILEGDETWKAPGGGTAYVDPENGESLFVFHAFNMARRGAVYLWLKHIAWQNDWPLLM